MIKNELESYTMPEVGLVVCLMRQGVMASSGNIDGGTDGDSDED